jgi:PilZ domain
VTIATVGQVVIIGTVPLGSPLRAELDARPNARIFAEADFLRALETIISDAPQLIAINPEFAATARGASLVARVRTDLRLSGSEVRAFATGLEGGGAFSVPLAPAVRSTPAVLQPLDRCGTRSATRFPMSSEAEIRVNGCPSRLVNLSVTGAQVLAPFRLRPSEGVRLMLIEESTETRLSGTVAWATLEIAKGAGGQRYRFGMEFRNPNSLTLERYCLRYRQDADPLLPC